MLARGHLLFAVQEFVKMGLLITVIAARVARCALLIPVVLAAFVLVMVGVLRFVQGYA